QYELLTEAARTRVGDYLLRVLEKPDPIEDAVFFFSLAPEELRPQIVARWRRFVEKHSRPDDPVFGPWHDLMALPAPRLRTPPKATLSRIAVVPVYPLLRNPLQKSPTPPPPHSPP